MKNLLVIMLIIVPFLIYSQELQEYIPLDEEYLNLLSDLENANTNGYKSHWLNIEYNRERPEYKGPRGIDFSPGRLKYTNRQLDFAIIGDGFFKIILKNGNIGYTRNGEFTINNDTNELMTIDGYKLYDSIIIPPGFIKLSINTNHEIVTEYSDGKIVNSGFLNIYILDNGKLDYYKFNRKIFLYTGNTEEIGYDKIYNEYIECSNVPVIATIIEIIVIGRSSLSNREQE